jgi:hypothetical protein
MRRNFVQILNRRANQDHLQNVRLNHDNIAESLGFLGRIVHGKINSEWLREAIRS